MNKIDKYRLMIIDKNSRFKELTLKYYKYINFVHVYLQRWIVELLLETILLSQSGQEVFLWSGKTKMLWMEIITSSNLGPDSSHNIIYGIFPLKNMILKTLQSADPMLLEML